MSLKQNWEHIQYEIITTAGDNPHPPQTQAKINVTLALMPT